MEDHEIGQMELSQYLNVVVKRRNTIIVVVSIFFAVSLAVSFWTKPVYRVESSFEIGLIPGGRTDVPFSNYIMHPRKAAQLCQSESFKNRIREILSLPKDEDINFKTRVDEAVFFLFIDTPYPEKALKILNTALDILIKENNAVYEEKIKPLKEEENRIREQIDMLKPIKNEKRDLNYLLYLNQLHFQFADVQKSLFFFKRAKIISLPETQEKPIKPKPALNIAVGLVLGLLIGIFIAFFCEYIFKQSETPLENK